MDTIEVGSNYAITWYDAAHTIVLADIHNRWTWEDATHVISTIDNLHFGLDYDAYSIYVFQDRTNALPQGSALMHLRNNVTVDPPHQRLIIVVNAGMLIETMLRVVFAANKLTGIESKYRFVRSLEMALQEIEHYKQKHRPDVQ